MEASANGATWEIWGFGVRTGYLPVRRLRRRGKFIHLEKYKVCWVGMSESCCKWHRPEILAMAQPLRAPSFIILGGVCVFVEYHLIHSKLGTTIFEQYLRYRTTSTVSK